MDIEVVFIALIVLSSLQIGLGVLFVVRLILWLRSVANRRCSIVAANFTVVIYFFTYNRCKILCLYCFRT